MLIEITGEAEKIINNIVLSGKYDSQDTVIKEAIEALKHRDELQSYFIEEIKHKIEMGAIQSENDEIISATDANKEMDELKKQYV